MRTVAAILLALSLAACGASASRSPNTTPPVPGSAVDMTTTANTDSGITGKRVKTTEEAQAKSPSTTRTR